MTSGTSIPRQNNGPGWAAAAQYQIQTVPIPASPASTARWESLQPPMYRAAVNLPPGGQILAATSGSLVDPAATPPILRDCSMIYGCSNPPRNNGHGWAAAAQCQIQIPASPVSTAPWESLRPPIFRVAVGLVPVGGTPTATSGSLVDPVATPPVLRAPSMIFGCSTPSRNNGPG